MRMEEDKNRRNFFNTIDRIEGDFEKKITQISAGALALSISFIDKIVDLAYAQDFWILIIGWFLLVSTLSINLISILISRKLNMKSLNDYDKISDKELTENQLKSIIKKRNNIITNLDFVQLGTLLFGIIFVVLFSSININNKTYKMPNKDKIEEKGRTIQTPQTSPQTTNDNNNQSGSNGSSSNGNQTTNTESKD